MLETGPISAPHRLTRKQWQSYAQRDQTDSVISREEWTDCVLCSPQHGGREPNQGIFLFPSQLMPQSWTVIQDGRVGYANLNIYPLCSTGKMLISLLVCELSWERNDRTREGWRQFCDGLPDSVARSHSILVISPFKFKELFLWKPALRWEQCSSVVEGRAHTALCWWHSETGTDGSWTELNNRQY